MVFHCYTIVAKVYEKKMIATRIGRGDFLCISLVDFDRSQYNQSADLKNIS